VAALLIRWMYFGLDPNAPLNAATAGHVVTGFNTKNIKDS